MHMFLVVLHFEVFFGFEYNINEWIAKNEECIYKYKRCTMERNQFNYILQNDVLG